jgi:hypothetical protein
MLQLPPLCPHVMEPMTKVRLPVRLWDAVKEMAEVDHRSATVQLSLVVMRGLGGRAGAELAALSAERTAKMLGGLDE